MNAESSAIVVMIGEGEHDGRVLVHPKLDEAVPVDADVVARG